MSNQQDLMRVLRYAQSQGWTVERSGSGHMRVLSPDGSKLVLAPRSPSDYRSFANTVADLRRAGLDLPRKGQKAKLSADIREQYNVAVLACEDIDIDLNVETWPHVSAIIGQWRSDRWFDEATGSPLSEGQVEMPSDRELAAAYAFYAVGGQARLVGDEYVFTVDETRIPTVAKGKALRIRVDAWRFWQGADPTPNVCTCGKSWRVDPEHGPFLLAQHLVNEHERAGYDHAPASPGLRAWEDPMELTALMSDPLAEELERTRKWLDESREATRTANDKLTVLRGMILRAVEESR